MARGNDAEDQREHAQVLGAQNGARGPLDEPPSRRQSAAAMAGAPVRGGGERGLGGDEVAHQERDESGSWVGRGLWWPESTRINGGGERRRVLHSGLQF